MCAKNLKVSLLTQVISKFYFPLGGGSESQTRLSRSRVATEKSEYRISDHKDRASDGQSESGKGHR